MTKQNSPLWKAIAASARALAAGICALVLIGSLALSASAVSPAQLPDLDGDESTWAIDQADVLSRATEGKISSILQGLARTSDERVRVVTIRGLDYGETIDRFADALFSRWFPTPEAGAKQTLIAMDSVTNNVAIRSGQTAARILTPEIAESTIAETIGQPIRQGNKYNEAIVAASTRLAAVLSGQPDPGPPEALPEENIASTFTAAEDTDRENSTVWVIALVVAATAIPMMTYFAYILLTDDPS